VSTRMVDLLASGFTKGGKSNAVKCKIGRGRRREVLIGRARGSKKELKKEDARQLSSAVLVHGGRLGWMGSRLGGGFGILPVLWGIDDPPRGWRVTLLEEIIFGAVFTNIAARGGGTTRGLKWLITN